MYDLLSLSPSVHKEHVLGTNKALEFNITGLKSKLGENSECDVFVTVKANLFRLSKPEAIKGTSNKIRSCFATGSTVLNKMVHTGRGVLNKVAHADRGVLNKMLYTDRGVLKRGSTQIRVYRTSRSTQAGKY